jgi:hypothetical protein
LRLESQVKGDFVLVEWITMCQGVEDVPGGWTVHGAGGVLGLPIELPNEITVPLAVSLLGLNDTYELHTIYWAVADPDGTPIEQHQLTFGSELPAANEVPEGVYIRRIIRIDCGDFPVQRPGIYTLRCWAKGQQQPVPAVQVYVDEAP